MKFRVARHTSDFQSVITFYTDLIGLELLGKFENHGNYDGIFIGKPNASWHMEFTRSNENAVHTFDEDDLLVFYPESLIEYNEILARFEKQKRSPFKSKNPYWKDNGVQFLDPDGYGVIISALHAI